MDSKRSENSADEILVLGNELLKMFQDELLITLEHFLAKQWGPEWLTKCSILDGTNSDAPKKDLQFLLKQIVQKNNGNFRLALAKNLFEEQKLTKIQLDALMQIQKHRNEWAHPDSAKLRLNLLQELANQILSFYGGKTNAVVEYCAFILRFEEKDQDAIPRILANSVLFRKHVGKIDNLVQGIAENANLLAEITQLKDKLKKSPTTTFEPTGLIPGYEYLTYEELQKTLDALLHSTTSLLRTFVLLNMALGAESMKVLSISKSLTRSKAVKNLIEDYESKKNLESLATMLQDLTKVGEDFAGYTPEDCDCQFCVTFGKGFAMMSEVRIATELTTQIYSLIRKVN